jgi:hypothetical protein
MKLMGKLRILLAAITMVLTTFELAIAKTEKSTQADVQSEKVESILDKLETKFLDREAAPLTYEESKQPSKSAGAKPIETLQINERKPIEGKTPNQKILQEIQAKISTYDTQVDLLEADSRKSKSDLIDQSNTNNSVHLEAKLSSAKTAVLQSLTVRIDGSLIFNQSDAAGMWIPTSAISLYQGPVQPGEHTVDVEAVLSRVNESGIPVSGWVSQRVAKKFSFEIPAGSVAKKISIVLDAGEGRSTKATAQLIENGDSDQKKESR